MLIDLHCHTLPLSQCSSLEIEQLAALAKQRGLDGICLTEHDRLWDPAAIDELRSRAGVAIFAGVELTTDAGHVLAFGLSEMRPEFSSAESLAAAARECGAALFLAHPARDPSLRMRSESAAMFDSLETMNGSDSRLQNLSVSGLAKSFRLPGVGGSDAHTPAEVGRAATAFDNRLHDEDDLLAALRSGRYRAVSLG